MTKNIRYLDWIRVLAVFLVLYGHFANAASWITQEDTVFSDKFILPINPGVTHNAYFIDTFFAKFGTASAVIGVILFLWLTGYLTAKTRSKYSGKIFILKRSIRLFPSLLFSVVFCGIIGYFMGVRRPLIQYVLNIFLIYPFLGYGATIGTLWTLVVELIFYIIILHFNNLDFRKIFLIDLIILALIVYQAITKLGPYTLLYSLKFVPIILFGSMLFEFHNIKNFSKYFKMTIITILTYLIPFIAIKYTYTSEVNYMNLSSYIFAFLMWVILFALGKVITADNKYVNRVIKFIVNNSYLIYLLQLNVGFTTMYYLKQWGWSPYLNILGGVVVTFLVSAFVHKVFETPITSVLNRKLSYFDDL